MIDFIRVVCWIFRVFWGLVSVTYLTSGIIDEEVSLYYRAALGLILVCGWITVATAIGSRT